MKALNEPGAFDDHPDGPPWISQCHLAPGDAPALEPGHAGPRAGDGYEPDEGEVAFHVGFTLGLGREDADPPSTSSAAAAWAFRAGWSAGSREWGRRLEEMTVDHDWLHGQAGASWEGGGTATQMGIATEVVKGESRADASAN